MTPFGRARWRGAARPRDPRSRRGKVAADIAGDLRVERSFLHTVPCESGPRIEVAGDLRVAIRTSK
eukprot:15458520-Alexandrium_andersonii.AAC.1